MKHFLLSCVLCWASCALLSAQTDHSALIQSFLDQHAASQGLQPSDVAHWTISSTHTSRNSGATYVYLYQTYQGIEVGNDVTVITIKDGAVISMGNRLISNLNKRINPSPAVLNPRQAIERAAQALGLAQPTGLQVEQAANTREFMFNKGGIAQENIPVKLVYAPAGDEDIRLAWDLSIYQLDGKHWWSVKVDALTGKLLHQSDWVVHCDFGHGRNFKPHTHFRGPQFSAPEHMQQPDQYTVFALPAESPNHGPHIMVTNPADSLASPYGWHDTNGAAGAEYTITRGNNVYAYEDRDDDNQPGFSPDGGALLEFNFPYTAGTVPTSYESAAITNLFYMNNMMHDVWYHYGFDENAGNFQTNNYGRGGSDDDEVRAEAQDGGGTNNANFATPPDGNNPRMQMYLWTSAGSTLLNALEINSPAGIAGSYGATGATFGPGLPTPPITADLVLVQDAVAPAEDGCDSILNPAALAGRIAVIDRGNCTFALKVEQAQAAGAVAVIVVNNAAGAPIQMSGTSNIVTIPSIMVTQADGNIIKAAMANGTVNGTISDPGGGSSSDKDGDFDNGIIAHEYGHGISTRMAGGRNTSNCLNSAEQMGEGWSDWFGLMLTLKPTDQRTDVRGIGTFAAGQPVTGVGIRPAPYSTDFAVNNFTYGSSNNAGQISQPHGLGFVYATALWEMTWDLIDLYGGSPDPDLYNGTGGNNIAMHLVIESFNEMECNPGMLDGRDAVLKADSILYNGIHSCLIWEAFARRGFGASADQGSPNSRTDQVEAFDIPTTCQTATVPPVAAFTPSSTNTCITTVSFTDNSTDVPQSWLWTFGDGDSSTVRNPTHVFRQSGTYTVTLVVMNTQGSDTTTQQVTILLPAAPTANDVEVCAGDTARIIATASGEVRWRNIANNIIYRGDTLVVPNTGTVQTFYMENVVATASQNIGPANPNIGSSAIHRSAFHGALNFTASRALEIVSVYVEADGAGPRTFYLASGTNTNGNPPSGADIVDQITVNLVDGGQRVNLNLNVPGAGNYNLGGNNVDLVRNSAGANYPYTVANYMSITSSSATTNPAAYYYYFYDIEIRDPACVSALDTVKVTPVVSNFTFNVANSTVDFTDASVDASSWSWDFGDSTTSTSQSPTHTYNAIGTYTVTLSINGGTCVSTQQITITTIDVNKINGNLPTLQLLPNPAQDQTALLLSRAAEEDLTVEVRDAAGKTLYQRTLPQGNTRLDLPLAEFPAGVYLISIQGDAFTRTEKLVVE